MKTGDLCNRDVASVRPQASLYDASRLMRQAHVGCIIVTDDSEPRRPVGIITDRDIVVEVVAAGLDPRNVTAGEIMGPSLVVAREDEDALVSLKTMRRRGVRRLPVVDSAGTLRGIVTLDDLLEAGATAVNDAVEAIVSERALETWRRT
jgi:CBS domain-containing protein